MAWSAGLNAIRVAVAPCAPSWPTAVPMPAIHDVPGTAVAAPRTPRGVVPCPSPLSRSVSNLDIAVSRSRDAVWSAIGKVMS